MENCIQWCKANGINPPPPFYTAKHRVEEQEAEDDSEVRRVAGPRGVGPEFEAEQKARFEAEKARFDALSQEEKLAELKAKLADNEQWITSAKEAGKQLAKWVLDYKAELERKIAEYSSPQRISLSPEEESQLLVQFPETWDVAA